MLFTEQMNVNAIIEVIAKSNIEIKEISKTLARHETLLEKINITLESLVNNEHTFESSQSTAVDICINVELPIQNDLDLQTLEDKLINNSFRLKMVSSNNNNINIYYS